MFDTQICTGVITEVINGVCLVGQRAGRFGAAHERHSKRDVDRWLTFDSFDELFLCQLFKCCINVDTIST